MGCLPMPHMSVDAMAGLSCYTGRCPSSLNAFWGPGVRCGTHLGWGWVHRGLQAWADQVLGQMQLMQHLRISGDRLSVPSGGSMSHGACIIVLAHRKQWKQMGRSGSTLGPLALVNERWVQHLQHLASSGDLLKVLRITLIH